MTCQEKHFKLESEQFELIWQLTIVLNWHQRCAQINNTVTRTSCQGGPSNSANCTAKLFQLWSSFTSLYIQMWFHLGGAKQQTMMSDSLLHIVSNSLLIVLHSTFIRLEGIRKHLAYYLILFWAPGPHPYYI